VPRPCLTDHAPSPRTCRVCYWCVDPSEKGTFHRRLWGEPEPDAAPTGPAREIVPGLLDPIPEGELRPVPPGWAQDPRVIRRHRDGLAHLARAPLPSPGARRGAGVVLVGGGRYWPGIVVAVKMLRDAGSRLPVQIWHRGAAEPVFPDDLAGVEGVEVRDLTALEPAPRVLRGWEAKTVALLACGWERIFFLDADAYCVADPTPLLDRLSATEPFLFWEDLPGTQRAVTWPTWGLGGSPVPPVQGGQFALHVGHFWRELVMAHWLNQHSDFSYSHCYGDQDSWRVALTVTGGRYGLMGPARWEEIAFVCDAEGQPLVVHRCRSKMLSPEDVRPTDVESNRRLARLPGEARAWTHWTALMAARPAAEVFGRIYASGLWGPDQISGGGSTPQQAGPYLDVVNGLVRVSGWRRVVDLGCGDGWVASRLAAPEVVGVDCHAPHVNRLRREMPGREWLHLDLDRDREQLSAGDAALLKDVLHHWPNRLVRDWLTWARRCGKWRWVVCTQDRGQGPNGQDCPLGGYRGLDPVREPLRGLGLVPLCHYLHKSVLLLAAGSE
jgi:SAM-dependent methyltransferase